MQKNLSFDTYEEVIVREESLKGLLLKFRPIKDDGAGGDELCLISDLNKVGIDIAIKRASGHEVRIFEGYLEDLLLGLYAQNTKFELCKKATSAGYLMYLDLSPSIINLKGKDELVIKFKAQKTAFTGTVVSRSEISFHTMPAIGSTPFVPQVLAHAIGNGEINFDKDLGSGITKVTVATDYDSAYDASTEAKIETGDIRAVGFEKSFTEPQLLAENMNYFDNNPESDVQDMVAYWGDALQSAKLRFKLTKGALQNAKVLTLGMVSAR